MAITKLTRPQLQALFPKASKDKIDLYLEGFNQTIIKYNINTPYRLAAFCAQLEVESGSLHYVEELADGSAYEYREDLGNLEIEALDVAHSRGTTSGRYFKG